MGTIEDPDPDRDRLAQDHSDTGGGPFTVEARAERMGRLAEGTGDSRMARIGRFVIKTTIWMFFAALFLSLLAELLKQS